MSQSVSRAAALGIAASLFAVGAQSLEEVIVTATRSPVALLGYPGCATRFGAVAIELTGATHSSELLNRAPGTMIQRGSGQEALMALRSPVLTGAGACAAVLMLVLEDSIPIRPVGTCNVEDLGNALRCDASDRSRRRAAKPRAKPRLLPPAMQPPRPAPRRTS
jgi:hypothetical protein